MTILWRTRAAAVVVAAVLGGCADDGAERPPVAWTAGEPTIILGGDPEAGPGHDLERIVTARQLPDSTIVIADGGSGELRRFDALGRLVTTMGVRGSAEQIQELGSLWIGEDGSTFVHDPAQQRISQWSANGTLAGITRVNLAPRAHVLRGDSTRIIAAEPIAAPDPTPGTVRTDSITLVALDLRTGRRGREVRLEAGQTFAAATAALRDDVLPMPLPFAPAGYIGASHSQVYYAHSAADQVVMFDLAAREQNRHPIAWTTIALTPALKAAWLEEQVGRADTEQDQVRSFYAAIPLPDQLPPFDALLVGTDDRLWFRHSPVPGTTGAVRWSGIALDHDDRYTLELPANTRPTEFGPDYVIAIVTGTNRVQRVVRLPLRAQLAAR